MKTGPAGPVSDSANLFCSAMNQFQLKVVFSDSTAPRERHLSLGSIWRFQTHFPFVSRCKTPFCRRFQVRKEQPQLKMSLQRHGLWLRSAGLHQTICHQQTQRPSSCPSPKKHAANRRPVAVTRSARALAPTNRCGLFTINAARRLTRFRPLPASKRGSRSNRSSCSIMLRPSMPWSRGCPRRLQNDAWPLTSSPDLVRFA